MSQITLRKGLLLLFALLIMRIVMGIVEGQYSLNSDRRWRWPVTGHDVLPNPQFEELWHTMAYIDCMGCPVATENNVYFSGSLKSIGPELLISLDAHTGQVEWQQKLQRNGQTLEGLSQNYFYISQGSTQKIAGPTQRWGAAQIIAYDTENRNEVWAQRFTGSTSVSLMVITEDFLVVKNNRYRGYYRVDARTGQIITESQQRVVLLDREEIQYLLTVEARGFLHGVNPDTGDVIWTHDISVSPQFVFEEELILIGRTLGGDILGGVTVLDGRTGQVLWEHERVGSSVAISNGIAYFIKLGEGHWGDDLRIDAKLLAVDIRTGETVGTLRFDPGKIESAGDYLHLVAANDNILFVYLGDSRRLFAIRSLINE